MKLCCQRKKKPHGTQVQQKPERDQKTCWQRRRRSKSTLKKLKMRERSKMTSWNGEKSVLRQRSSWTRKISGRSTQKNVRQDEEIWDETGIKSAKVNEMLWNWAHSNGNKKQKPLERLGHSAWFGGGKWVEEGNQLQGQGLDVHVQPRTRTIK